MEPREHSGLSPALDEPIASSLERFVSTSRSMDLLDDTMDSPSRRTPDLDGPLPAQIGRFEVRSRLGAGGMGVVYAAHDHPNVVSVYEVGRVDDQICLVMELVRGLDLGRWLGRETRSWDQVLAVYCDAGRGLAAAHAAGLIHRDFKPSNAIVGDDGRIGVLDFGLARGNSWIEPSTPPPINSRSASPSIRRSSARRRSPAPPCSPSARRSAPVACAPPGPARCRPTSSRRSSAASRSIPPPAGRRWTCCSPS